MRRDLNVKFYVGVESELPLLTNVGDFFRAEDTGKLYRIKEDGSPEEVGAGGGSAVKVLRALINQSGSATPTITILENTLGVVPTIAQNGTGSYNITATGAFTADKTFPSIGTATDGDLATAAYITTIGRVNDNTCTIAVATNDVGTPENNVISNTPVEILVYE